MTDTTTIFHTHRCPFCIGHPLAFCTDADCDSNLQRRCTQHQRPTVTTLDPAREDRFS